MCPNCEKAIYKNHQNLVCQLCNYKFHRKCANVDMPVYKKYKNSHDKEFYFCACTLPKFSDDLFVDLDNVDGEPKISKEHLNNLQSGGNKLKSKEWFQNMSFKCRKWWSCISYG